MSTGTALCDDALMAANITSSVVPADPTQQDNAFTRLRTMMQLWLSWGIVFDIVPTTAIGEDLNEPIDARNAIVDNLAVSVLQFYRLPVTQELLANARLGLYQVKSLYQELTIPNKVVSSTLPKGAGNSKGVDARVFFPPGDSVEN